MAYSLPSMPYAYDALEPHIDARTMEIHHTKHHNTYVTSLNKALEGQNFGNPSVEELVAAIHTLPEELRTAVRNHGGGHANHSLFWTILGPTGSREPKGELAKAIDKELGGFSQFCDRISKVALGRFGSGWAWLSVDPQKSLVVEDTPNQNSPLMHGNIPILGIDVWEHAYYLKYQNRRADYVQAIFNVFNWDAISDRYQDALARSEQIAQTAGKL